MSVRDISGTSEIHRRPLHLPPHPGLPPSSRSASASFTPGLAAQTTSSLHHANASLPVAHQYSGTSGQAHYGVLNSARSTARVESSLPSSGYSTSTTKRPKITRRDDEVERRVARRTGASGGERLGQPGNIPRGMGSASWSRPPTDPSPLSLDSSMAVDSTMTDPPLYTGLTSGFVGDMNHQLQHESASSSANSLPLNVPIVTSSVATNADEAKPAKQRRRTTQMMSGVEPTGIIGPSPNAQGPPLSAKAKGKRRAVATADGEKAPASKRRKTSDDRKAPAPLVDTSQVLSLALNHPTGSEVDPADISKSSLHSVRSGPARYKKVVLYDANGVPLPEPTGTRPPKLKKGVRITPWKSVRPLASTTTSHPSLSTTAGPPRIWCSSFEDLEAAAPIFDRSAFWCGVRRGMFDAPTLLFLDANDKQSNLGLHPNDSWSGRQLKFTMCYEYKMMPTSVTLGQSSLQIKEETLDATLPKGPLPDPPPLGVRLEAPQIEPSTSASSYSSLEVVFDVDMDMSPSADLTPDPRLTIKIPPRASALPSVHQTLLLGGNPSLSSDVSRMADLRLGTSDAAKSGLPTLAAPSTVDSPAPFLAPRTAEDVATRQVPATPEKMPAVPVEHPPPPPEVQMLLDASRRKGPVAPVVSKKSPIMPWLLPDDVGCVWAGLFTIEDVEESTANADPSTSTVRRSWTFQLLWVPGGEFLLRDEEKDGKAYDDWLKTVERPWWETRADTVRPPGLKTEAEIRAELVPSLIPEGLLATFLPKLLGESNFPHGFYCQRCGRVNVQVSLVRQDCKSASCPPSTSTSVSATVVAEWVPARTSVLSMADSAWVPAISTRVLKLNGMSTRTYSIPNGDDIYAPPADGTALHMTATHIFTSNMIKHQESPSEMFTKIQRCIPLQRSPTEFAFLASATFPLPSGDAVNGRRYEVNAFGEIEQLVRERVAEYGHGIGTLEVKKLSIKTWIAMKEARVKEDLPRVPEGGAIVLMCLGANTQISYTPQAMKAPMKKDERFKSAAKKDALRVMLIHGDVFVVSGAAVEAGLQLGMMRTGTTILLIAECAKETPV
ncbi:unnamed protein product [Peniophora sp. CBMAI 1063]|nr:unnamed protein product [Peniophora sp. CBMAI 1063]